MLISDMTITLEVDEETLKERIAVRTNPFGKQPHELDIILEHRKKIIEHNKSNGTEIVDATQPIGKVADDMIKMAEKLPHK